MLPAVARKVALRVPAGIVTLAGTVKSAELLESAMVLPFPVAALASVTVQVDNSLEASVAGVQVRDVMAGAVKSTLTVVVRESLLYVAVMVAV